MRFLSLFLAFFIFNANAGTLICSGKVKSVAYHGNDKLMVQLSSMNYPVFFCNPNADWSVSGVNDLTMSSETCKAVFSMFLSARTSGGTIERVQFEGDDVPASCSQFQPWKNVSIRHIHY